MVCFCVWGLLFLWEERRRRKMEKNTLKDKLIKLIENVFGTKDNLKVKYELVLIFV